jgi:hypothetical protein
MIFVVSSSNLIIASLESTNCGAGVCLYGLHTAAREPKTALAKEFNVSRETLYQAGWPHAA